MVFGAAAWKVAVRDRFIGWSVAQRQQHLGALANQQRFLILPWVRVAHLASHLLARATRRLSADWQARYGHPVWLVETFVELRIPINSDTYSKIFGQCSGIFGQLSERSDALH